jgi:hypothetical protein
MTVLDKLATALNRRDEVPNQELAQRIAEAPDKNAIQELVDNLGHKDKNIQSDCIKVLYEIGARRPELIAGHYKVFGRLLGSKHNRLVWGAMTALDTIALKEPKGVYGMLPRILVAADAGSVITRDHAVGILAKLASLQQYAERCTPLLIEQLIKSPNNQFAMYAERSVAVIDEKNKERFQTVLMKRVEGLEKESQKKRVRKILKMIEKKRQTTAG